MRFCKKTILALLILSAFFLLMILADYIWYSGEHSHLLINQINIVWFIIFLLMLSPSYWQEFKKNIIIKKPYHWILGSVVIGIILNFLLSITTFLPLFFDMPQIGPAAGQVKFGLPPFSIASLMFNGFIPSLSEELFFRFFMFSGLIIMARSLLYTINLKEKTGLTNALRKLAIPLWGLATVSVFAISHSPDITNFHIYFIGGLVYLLIYVRYGLLSSILCHMSFNYFSPFSYSMAYILIKYIALL